MPASDREFAEQEMIMDRDRERNAEDDEASAPESGGWREKLKPAAHYALLAFAPVVSIVALIVALVASGNRSDQAQLVEVNARIDKLEASLQASRAEVENLKFAMSREKSLRGDERKKDEELDAKVIQNVSRLQAKLKVTPTLEEQLRTEANAPVAASHVESTAPVAATASAPVAPGKAQAASAPASAGADRKPAVPVTAPKTEGKKPEAPAKKVEQKMSPQVKAIKDAIDQYNKQ
jgi:hypothetical protein